MFDVREGDWSRVGAIEAEVAEIAGQQNALNGRLAVPVAEHRSLGGCADLSPRRWVAWQLGCSASTAGAIAAVAERVSDLPVTVAALRAGEVSVDQAACIARHAPAYADAEVRGFARSMTVPQLSRVCRANPHFDDQPDDEAAWKPEREQVSAGFDEAGWWQLRDRLDADRGAVVDGALSHHYQALVADRPGPDVELPTLGDALVRMAQHSLSGTDRSGSAQVVVHVDAGGTVRLHQGPDAERPDGITFRDRFGRHLPTVVPPIPPADRSPPDVAPYRHPDGGRLYACDVVFQSADRRERELSDAG